MNKKSVFSVKEAKLFARDTPIETPLPVAQIVHVQDTAVVRLDVPVGTTYNRNVLAYSSAGALLWVIPESSYGGTSDQPYVSIEGDADGQVIARNWNGVEYAVDVENGRITVLGLRRF